MKNFIIGIYLLFVDREYRKYVFEKHNSFYGSKLNAIICRMRAHPAGVKWYNYGLDATEPDMHCKNCGDDLG